MFINTFKEKLSVLLGWCSAFLLSLFIVRIIAGAVSFIYLFSFIAFFILLVSFIFWKKAVIFVMFWILLVGAVRKWLLPEAADLVFFTPHLILTGVYLRFFGERLIRGSHFVCKHPIMGLLTLFFFWGMLSAINPQLPDFRVGILGIIIHFYYVPVAIIVPYIFSTKEDLISFFKKYALFSFPLLILGVIQFFSPVHSPINRYVTETKYIATAGLYPRVSSTFSYISGYTSYLTLLVLILVYLLNLRSSSKKLNMVLYILIPLTLLNLLMTGSRGPVYFALISIVVYFLITLKSGVSFLKKSLPKFIFTIISIVIIVLATNTGILAYKGFMERGSHTEDIMPRLIDTFTPFKFLNEAGLFGYGIGCTYQGAARFVTDWPGMIMDFEEEPERILLEMGLIGYVLVYGLRFLILFYIWKLFKKLRCMDLKLLAFASFLFQLQFLHFNNLVFNLTSGLFYWFLAGFIFLLPKLGKREVNFAQAKGNNFPSW